MTFCDKDNKPRIRITRPPESIKVPNKSSFAFLFFGRLNGKKITHKINAKRPIKPTKTHIQFQPIEAATKPAVSEANKAAIGIIIETIVITLYSFPA